MARYDEDLHENLFFQTLIGKYSNLFKEAAEQRWLIHTKLEVRDNKQHICIPRCDTVFRLKLGRTDFENHILRSSEADSKQFISLNNKKATIDGDIVKVGEGYKETRSVKILFDECFFNSREESYQVFCLEQPMEGAMGNDIMISLKNLEECSKFLWGNPGAERMRRSVDKLIDIFQVERGSMSMRPIMDAALAVYTRAVQEVFKIRKFEAAMHKNFCKLAVETYVMAGLHKKIFKEVCFIVAVKDAALNKITRNLSDTNPESLGIKPQFKLILPKARAILSQLNQFTTPLEKLYCFSQTINALTSTSLEVSNEVVTADELLPILVYLVIVTDIPNWNGNLTYIHRFYFSNVTIEEFTYYLTSFEAAVEYVRSEHMNLTNQALASINHASVQRYRSNSAPLEDEPQVFFNLVSEGNVEAVKLMLEKAQVEKSNLKSNLCHPLCECTKCLAILEKQLDDSASASVYLRDQDGRTGLHHAALMGHNELVQLLIEHGSIVMATDHNSSTPLHLSCLKGHQKCTLLLLGEGSSINAVDNHGNTPLHQACSNGHEECVKSLLFHTTQCEVNLTNDQGDTPLHNAARWGYASIVSELLGMNASLQIQNRRREFPQQCAQNRKVQELLYTAYQNTKRKSTSDIGGGGGGGGEDIDSPVIIRSRRMSKRMSMRDSLSDVDRQLKKLFRAIQDGDTNLVNYIFGWEEYGGTVVSPEDICHPLCVCDRCSKLKKTSSVAVLSVNCCDGMGHSPLHKACLLGQRTLVELFLLRGALIDTRTKDTDQTPLHLACQYNHKDTVVKLLEYRAHISPQDSRGNTPLHLACTNGHIETVALLLMHGADVTVTNHRGDTPLHNAARWNSPHLVHDLLLYGASYTATNKEGKLPIDLTADEDVMDIIWKASKGIITVGSYSPLHKNQRQEDHCTNGVKSTMKLEEGGLLLDHVTVVEPKLEEGGLLLDHVTVVESKLEEGGPLLDHVTVVESKLEEGGPLLDHVTVVEPKLEEERELDHVTVVQQMEGQLSDHVTVVQPKLEGHVTVVQQIEGVSSDHVTVVEKSEALGYHDYYMSDSSPKSHDSSSSPFEILEHKILGNQVMQDHQEEPTIIGEVWPPCRPHPPSMGGEESRPKRNEKLISLLQAIESFDRSTLTSNRSQNPFPDTPPYSPSSSPSYYPLPADEEMQTTGLGMGTGQSPT